MMANEYLNHREPGAGPFRYVILDRSTVPNYPCPDEYDPEGWDKTIIVGFLDPEPWTWRRFYRERAFIRCTDSPIIIGIDRDGFLLNLETPSNAFNAIGMPTPVVESVYKAIEEGNIAEGNSLIDNDLARHNEEVRQTLIEEDRLKKLTVLAQLITAMPELKQTPTIKKMLAAAIPELEDKSAST